VLGYQRLAGNPLHPIVYFPFSPQGKKVLHVTVAKTGRQNKQSFPKKRD
jgi:hypothetical protein